MDPQVRAFYVDDFREDDRLRLRAHGVLELGRRPRMSDDGAISGGAHVEAAVAAMLAVLSPQTGRDWRSLRAGTLEWSCWQTGEHVAHDLLAYAGQVAGQPTGGYLPFDLSVLPEATPAKLLDVVGACGKLLTNAIAAVSRQARGWHWGPTDSTGFAALGVNETLVHTWDITRGLGLSWEPPSDLAALVLARLFPDAPHGQPGQVLLWSTGRVPLGDRPPPEAWTVRAARG